MDKTIIETIYQIIAKGFPLTTQTLIEHGLTMEDIKSLVDENVITNINNEKFELVSTEGLYIYGVKLFLLRQSKNAYQCFKKCFELDSSNRDYCLQIMLCELKLGQAASAFERFPHLEQISKEQDIYDNNLYLYIFNMLTRCPAEYVERVRNMDYDSYLYPYDMEVPFKDTQNKLRQLITKNKIKNALHLQNDVIAKTIRYTVSDEILKELIIRLVNLESKFKAQILDFAKNKNYAAIISFLETKSKKRYLTNEETYAYLICQSIINISLTHIIPPITVSNPQDSYDAIKGNNFAFALNLETEFLQFYQQDLGENFVHILLSQINELIDELEQPTVEAQELPKTLVK